MHTGSGDHTVIEADVNGNGVADFQIEFGGLYAFSTTDFVL